MLDAEHDPACRGPPWFQRRPPPRNYLPPFIRPATGGLFHIKDNTHEGSQFL